MSLFYNQDTACFDIVIVGGGMVGACLAALLGEAAQSSPPLAALKIGLLESNSLDAPWQEGFDPRVSALTVASQRVLESVGAWELMKTHRVSPFRVMDVWDAEGTGSIQFYAEELAEVRLGHIVENRVIQKSLIQRCREYSQIEILCPEQLVRIEKTTAEVSLLLGSDRVVQTKLLVGADGANSFVRNHLNFSLRVRDYHHDAIVTTVKTEKPHQATAWQRFTPSGPIAFLPLSSDREEHDGHYCSLVWSTLPEEARGLLERTDEAFCEALTLAFEERLGRVEWCDKRYSYALKQRHVAHYIQDNIALIGDAAHTIHPLAGQGVNLGFMD
ncbi:MAG: FAD-dependent monooxygenase, partial [Pseudomonadales bacterium]|nr:FAD-dependent monooxygenase [Pseudomonadales bacterium]